MKPERSSSPWSRLAAAARSQPDERAVSAPFGFATRVAALALAQEPRATALLERFALRALGIACLLAVASVAMNFRAVSEPDVAVDEVALEDPMSVLLDL